MQVIEMPIRRSAARGIRRALGAVGVVALLAAMTPAMAQVYVNVAPPAARVEVIPPRPHPGWVWRPGYWAWHGHWAWVGGHYARPPHAGAAWVSGHWAHRPRGWVWVGGHWR